MKDRNENRPGYKKTKIGWIPEEWDYLKFDSVLQRIRDEVIVNPNKEYCEIGVRSHGKGIFHKPAVLGSALGSKSVFWVRPEALVFNIVFAWEQAVSVISAAESGFIASHRFPMYVPKSNKVLNEYIYYFFLSNIGKHLLSLASPGGAGRNRTLGQKRISNTYIPLPSLPEQKKIAEILSTWDKAIKQTRKLVETKKRRKKALMQQLLTGKKRLSGFTDAWTLRKLGDLFSERIERNYESLELLAITRNYGVVSASTLNRKDSSSSDKSKYKRIAKGDIGYNTMRMWQGVSALSKHEGIISPAYTVCIPNDTIHGEFAAIFFKFCPVVHTFWRYSQGLVNDTLNLKFHNFSQIHLKIPGIDEQYSIADVLSSADMEIKTLDEKLSALMKQKRGLMQKLLTGEIRTLTVRSN